MIVVTNSVLAWESELAVFFGFLNNLHKNVFIHKTLKAWDHQIICKHKILYMVCFYRGDRRCRRSYKLDFLALHHA